MIYSTLVFLTITEKILEMHSDCNCKIRMTFCKKIMDILSITKFVQNVKTKVWNDLHTDFHA